MKAYVLLAADGVGGDRVPVVTVVDSETPIQSAYATAVHFGFTRPEWIEVAPSDEWPERYIRL